MSLLETVFVEYNRHASDVVHYIGVVWLVLTLCSELLMKLMLHFETSGFYTQDPDHRSQGDINVCNFSVIKTHCRFLFCSSVSNSSSCLCVFYYFYLKGSR